MKISLSLIALLLVMSSFAPSVASAASSRSGNYSDHYGVISERNIFLKDRAHPTTRSSAGGSGSSSTQPSSRTDPEHAMTLTGIVFEDNAYHAFLENRDSNTIQRVNVGDSVARGKIIEITIDGMLYENTSGQQMQVVIGSDLTGKTAAPIEPYALPSVASTMPSGVEGLKADDPNLTMEQKLKLRRAAELKGK